MSRYIDGTRIAYYDLSGNLSITGVFNTVNTLVQGLTERFMVAGGSGTNTLAYSSDGINWVASGGALFSACYAIAWNGTLWVAGGLGTNRLAYSSDGINWIGNTSGNAIFSIQCKTVAWNGAIWVAGGQNSNGAGVIA